MRAYLVHPGLTLGKSDVAERFFEECREQLEHHVDVQAIKTAVVAASAKPCQDEVVVVFNRMDQNYERTVTRLLDLAEHNGAVVFPIALDRDSRVPPTGVRLRQSYDITEQLRERRLCEDQIKTVAMAFARDVVAKLQPTLTKRSMQLFISHRRLDGEEVAAALCAALRARAEKAFRDLIDIRVGEDAQEIIEQRLRASDAVIFIDTPRTGESEWVARELSIALSLNLPIVWVRVGSEEARERFRVDPGTDKPHVRLEDITAVTDSFEGEIVDNILQTAFTLSRQSAQRVFEDLNRIRDVARRYGVDVEEVDQRNLIYSVKVPRRGFRYRQRPMAHLVQFLGRWPGQYDRAQFRNVAGERVREPGHYDTQLLLAPIPSQLQPNDGEDGVLVDSSEEYLNSLVAFLRSDTRSRVRKGVIISGAFPDCEPQHQQHVTDAVHTFAKAVFDRGGIVIFGSHPTFQHLILDLAKREHPDTFQQVVRMYLTRFFVTDPLTEEYRTKATVVATTACGSRAESLTIMRKAMIADDQALGLVAIGGKSAAGGHTPGVDEEVQLARDVGLPVFLVGSAGGRSAELASEYHSNGWQGKLNGLAPDDNEALFVNLDYRVLADRVLDSLGL